MARPRCFISLRFRAREQAIARGLRAGGVAVVEDRDTVHVVGHFDLAVVMEDLPPGIWTDVLVRFRPDGTASVQSFVDEEPDLEVSVDSFDDLMRLLTRLIWTERRVEPI